MSRNILILLMVLVAITLSLPNTDKKQHQKAAKNSSGQNHPRAHNFKSASRGGHPQASNQAPNPQPLASTNRQQAIRSKPPQTAAHRLTLQEPPKRPPLQIVGGQNAAVGEYPFHVSIRYAQYHLCSGTLIAPNVVLTAGQCVTEFIASDLRIVAGTAQLSSLGGQTHYVTEIIVHPELDGALRKNDIGLLRLGSSVRCNEDVQIIELESDELCGGEDAVVIGWGLTSYPEPITDTDDLKYVELGILSNADCLQRLPAPLRQYLHRTSICSFAVGKGLCFGDGGAPLVVDGKVAGLGSWGIPCAQGPDVYTRVSSFVAWINSILESGNCGDGGGCGCGGGSGCSGGCGCGGGN